ncbi:Formate-dependent phosphoribosylglycinamide formyltransferase (GAR transformylase) [Nitrosovibrio tenuis]|uniref:Formate-dependent phosphoribosylglycinamide formyltransferase (GAR transformylase) n=2 Tax=Nitrosovibrio tenuis TaxID=1233 RepID=A0A1H7GCU5_9PROT|nr:Formate-dependent phosphoribosylglycinamide formyltransferase (GAR transformylase) [Nitrosovibrio tenuis]
MDKKALLVGSSFSAAPLFFVLKKRGIHVSVCGNQESDPCHQYADASFYIDYSNRDELLHLVETENFDYIVPSCNDYAYMSCAWVAQRLGFPGYDRYDVATILHTKNEFRMLTEQHSLPAPKSRRQEAGQAIEAGLLHFPLLVKPVDSFSGRGVVKVLSGSDLTSAVQAALQSSRSNEVVLEEFVEGSLHSHSAFICKNEVVLDFFVDEYCTVYPYQVNCSNHPSFLPETTRINVRESITRLVRILGMADGLLHTQFIANGDKFWIIECMRRCPGDLYSSLVELSTGVGYVDLYVRPFLGETIPADVQLGESRYFGRHTISTSQSLVNYTFSYNIPDASVRVVPLKSSGERLGIAPFDKLAILFAEYSSRSTMLEATPQLTDFITIRSLEETYLEPVPPLST